MDYEPSREELESAYEKNSHIFFQMGLLAHDWAALEYSISQLIWRLADVHPAYGACITSQLYAVNGRMKAIISLMGVRAFDEKLIKKMNMLSQKIATAGETRNRVLHDSIGVERGTERFKRAVVKADRTLVFEGQTISAESISKERGPIIECLNEFVALYHQIVTVLPTLPEKPQSELSPIAMTWTQNP